MKKYFKEKIIILLQLLVFYVLPLFAGPTDIMGMVVLIILSTFILSALIICVSNEKIKYLYSLVVTLLFIPSVFIYYNESALIHSVWYLVVSSIGMLVGMLIRWIIKR